MIYQHTNNNNKYVNLHNATNLGLCNIYILVIQKQVLELYITVIEHKTLYSLQVPHTAFPNTFAMQQLQLKQQQRNTTTKVHVTKRGAGT